MAELLIVLVALGSLAVALLWPLIDVARRPADKFRPVIGMSKGAVIALIVLTGGLGGAYYLVQWRPPLIKAEIEGRFPKPPRQSE